jgi:hypothetical protein
MSSAWVSLRRIRSVNEFYYDADKMRRLILIIHSFSLLILKYLKMHDSSISADWMVLKDGTFRIS